MTDATPLPTAMPPMRVRRARLVGLVGLVAFGAGGTGALAATVSHHADTTEPTTPAPAVFLPYAGQAGATSGGGAADANSGVAPAALPAQAGMSAGAGGVAVPAAGAPVGSSIASPYPGPGICTGSAPAQVAGQVVTATGSATVGTAASSPVYVLNAWLDSQGADVSKAVSDVQGRLTAVVNALVAAGVSKGSIHTTNVSVYVSGQRSFVTPVAPGISTPSGGATTVNASANVSADLPNAGVIDRAVSAATGAGAQGVNVSTQMSAPATPPSDAVAAALATAADQAHQLATAAAKATGVTLGAVRSVSTQQPTVCGYSSEGPQLVVGVTVAYAIG